MLASVWPKQINYLVALGGTKNGNKIDKPERFDGTAFYPGAILLVGELVK